MTRWQGALRRLPAGTFAKARSVGQEPTCFGCRAFATAAPYSYDPPGRNHLFVPGPVNIHSSVQQAMDRPAQNHRDPWFNPFFSSILEDSKMLFGTSKGTTFIYPGTGTGGWEVGLTNTLSPGDKILTFRYGQFSLLWVDMMERLGLDVQVIDERWGNGVDEGRLEKALKADTDKKIKAIAVVHNETATGVTSDLPKIRETIDACGHPALFMVDGVSSIGALDFQMDKWKVDIAVTGSQKALSLPTGLAVVAVSDKALEARKTAKLKRVYFDLADMIKTNKDGQVPYTPVLPLLYGMQASMKLMKAEGFENVIKRHHRLAEGARKAVKGWGLELLCKDPRWRSDALTVIETPKGTDSNLVVKNAYAKYNLSLGVGLTKVAGKVFRIGHLGNMDEVMLLGALAGTEMALLDAGINIEPGSGVKEAVKHFRETSSVIPTREPPPKMSM
ncbi:hypothetical protein ABBQ38_013783 [Trebouxia sp. C0009 RCD-2024]